MSLQIQALETQGEQSLDRRLDAFDLHEPAPQGRLAAREAGEAKDGRGGLVRSSSRELDLGVVEREAQPLRQGPDRGEVERSEILTGVERVLHVKRDEGPRRIGVS